MKQDLYLINGPLGAGKTTFLKEFLKIPRYSQARIIENEFASVSVDTDRLHDHHAEIQTIAGVCTCCSTGDELTDALKLFSMSNGPVVIEATGVANSLRLIEKIVNADMLAMYTIRHTIFILDATEAAADTVTTLDMYRHELQSADTVLISKTDLLDKTQVERLMDALRGLRLRQVGFVQEGAFDASLLEVESSTLEYFARLDEKIINHDGGVSYTVLDTSDCILEASKIKDVWGGIQANYGVRRMKGNIQSQDGLKWHIEATPSQCKVSQYEYGALQLVVTGQDAPSVTIQTIQEGGDNG